MSLSFVETLALHAAGVDDASLAKIETALPSLAALLKLFKDNLPLIQQAQALAAKGLPLIKQATDEIAAVMPAADAIMAIVQKKLAPTPPAPDGDYITPNI